MSVRHTVLNFSSSKSKIPDDKINEPDQTGATPLHIAAKNNKVREVKQLLKRGADAKITDNEKRTALYVAARAGHTRVCETLLDKKYSSEMRPSVMPLLYRQQTVESQELVKVLQLCLDSGSNLAERDDDHNTPLHLAIENGTIETVTFLLKNKADPNAVNLEKMSPLHIAVMYKRSEIISLLLKASAATTALNNKNQTPLDIAKKEENQDLIDLLTECSTLNLRKIEASVAPTSGVPLCVRYGHACVTYQSKLYIIGGCDNKKFSLARKFYTDVLEIDVSTFEVVAHKCNLQREITDFSATLIGKLVYVSGGTNKAGEKSKDLWTLDLSEFKWEQHLTIPVQIPLDFHGSAPASRIELLFLGSSQNKEEFNALYHYDIVAMAWNKVEAEGIVFPPYREKYTCTRVRNNVYLFGGLNRQGKFLNDLWSFDQSAQTWQELTFPGAVPTPRCSHSATCVGHMFFIAGGIGNFVPQEDNVVYGLDPVENTWFQYELKGADVHKRLYSGFLIGSRSQSIYVYGGCDSPDLFSGVIEKKEEKQAPQAPSRSPRGTTSSKHGIIPSKRDAAAKTGISHRFRTLKGSATSQKQRSSKAKSLNDSKDSAVSAVASFLVPEKEEKPKRTETQLMEHIEDLDEYSNTLCTDTLHFIQLLSSFDPNAESSKEDRQLLASMCEELRIFCASSKPTFITDTSKIARELENQKKAQRFEKENFPYQYYQSLDVAREYNHPLPEGFETWSKEKTARYHIFNEIVQTETLYVNDLAVIIGLYMKPLQNEYKDLVGPYEFGRLFKNTELLLELNKNILRLLQEQQQKPCKAQDVGSVFLTYLSEIESKYITYSANQIAANEEYFNLMKSSTEFETFCNLVASLPESKGMSLDSYLIKPFQRVCRYSLLLKELEKQTPKSWPHAANVHKAKKAIDIVVGKANESKRTADSLVQVLEIQNRFDIGDPEIMQLHRYQFIREGIFKINVKKKAKKCCVFLFEECLLLTTATGKKLSKLRLFRTDCLILYDIEDAKPLKNVFTIVDISDNFKIDVSLPSPEEKKDWMNAINNADPSKTTKQ